jgi:SAM-dependent methyltransferase
MTALDTFLAATDDSKSVLHIGCGVGEGTAILSNSGYDVLGIDADGRSIAEARRRVPNVLFRRMNVARVRFPEFTFSGVWFNLPPDFSRSNMMPALAEIARVLVPGGVLALAFNKSEHPNCQEYEWQLGQAGFEMVGRFNESKHAGAIYEQSENIFVAVKRPGTSQIVWEDQETAQCLLCPRSRFRLKRSANLPSASSILWGDENLYVTPDLAPLIEGHILLITTRHFLNFGACVRELAFDMRRHQEAVCRLFRVAYGCDPLFLEHGSSQSATGACIDHAHWHCLPIGAGVIRDFLSKRLRSARPTSIEDLYYIHSINKPYLFVQEGLGHGIAYTADVIPSQFFREAIAAFLDIPNWRWRTTFQMPATKDLHNRTLRQLTLIADDLFD